MANETHNILATPPLKSQNATWWLSTANTVKVSKVQLTMSIPIDYRCQQSRSIENHLSVAGDVNVKKVL